MVDHIPIRGIDVAEVAEMEAEVPCWASCANCVRNCIEPQGFLELAVAANPDVRFGCLAWAEDVMGIRRGQCRVEA